VCLHLQSARARHALQRPLERGIGERLDLAAVVADEMVVMIAVRVRGLVPCDAVADVDTLYEPQIGELVDGPVDAGNPSLAPVRPDAVEDLLRRETAALLAEMLDDGVARAALAEPRLAEAVQRPPRPPCV